MPSRVSKRFLLILAPFLSCILSFAQERVTSIDHNPFLADTRASARLKTTALSLPFFEDFTGTGVFPDETKWTDRSVYVNNTMGFKPVSRGVATFDALNERGGPYDSSSSSALLYADSLTSQPIALETFQPGDSIYLSFFFQPQGNGFSPESQDSLMLFFKRTNGDWDKVWSIEGGTLADFTQVMIPVKDTGYLHNGFQFRYVNKASININDDVWNLDYIRMSAGRTIIDTAVNDVATSTEPSFILNDYTSMPYRQFAANINGELSSQHYFYDRNNYLSGQQVSYGYTAREKGSGTVLGSSPLVSATIPAETEQQFQFPMYPVSFAAPGPYSRVVFENKYYAKPAIPDVAENDTIVRQQVFDNYLAYDDGTAEKSYFLNQFATLPAKTAIEFHLNEPDTLRGVAIYFGRSVPLASNKFFSIAVYDNIALSGGTDSLLYEEELLFPGYADTVNHFWFYRFTTPVALKAGNFFIGTVQPTASGSDSLYFGLDVNRIGGNHLYFDVSGFWESSLVSGAVMMRPVLGQPVVGTAVDAVNRTETDWQIFPNPAQDRLNIQLNNPVKAIYSITDLSGRTVLQGSLKTDKMLDISRLGPGIYFVRILAAGVISSPKKIIKL